MIKVKRVYESAASDDGARFLVERLWPRGIKKSALKIDDWLKDVAPTISLRQWFAHDPQKWSGFRPSNKIRRTLKAARRTQPQKAT